MLNTETDSIMTEADSVVKSPIGNMKQNIDLLRRGYFNSFRERLKGAERLRLVGRNNGYGKPISESKYRALINLNKTELIKNLVALARMERRAIEVGDLPKY